jgi:hypothetical protein
LVGCARTAGRCNVTDFDSWETVVPDYDPYVVSVHEAAYIVFAALCNAPLKEAKIGSVKLSAGCHLYLE